MEDNSEDNDIYGICAQCGRKVEGEGTGCSAMDKVFHISCFSCFVCKINLQGKPFYSLEGKPYCESDYLNTLEKCCVCTRPVLDRILRATGKPYHPSCFTCVVCGQSLDGIPFTVDATNQIHCIQCFHKLVIFNIFYTRSDKVIYLFDSISASRKKEVMKSCIVLMQELVTRILQLFFLSFFSV